MQDDYQQQSTDGVAPRRRRRRLVAFAAVTLVGALVVGLALVETGLRVFNPLGVRERASWHFLLWEAIVPSRNPEMVWEYGPGYSRQLVGYRVSLNSLGLRGPEISAKKAPNLRRVVVLGDSMAFGMSGDQEDCMPAQLQTLLHSLSTTVPLEVVNAGVIGYNSLQEEALLREKYPVLQPDLVVLWWVHNDVTLTGAASGKSQAEALRDQVGYRKRTPGRHLLHAAYEILPCTVALARTAAIARMEGDRTHFQFRPEESPEGWAANRAAIERIAAFLKEHETPLIVYSFGKYDALERLCASLGVRYVTTVERAGIEHEREYAIHSSDPHFSRKGNAAVAGTLAPEILRALQTGN